MENNIPSLITEEVWQQNANSSWKILAPYGFANRNIWTCKKYMSVNKLMGNNTAWDKQEFGFALPSSTATPDSDKSAFWWIMRAPATAGNSDPSNVSYQVRITYYCEFYDKVTNL